MFRVVIITSKMEWIAKMIKPNGALLVAKCKQKCMEYTLEFPLGIGLFDVYSIGQFIVCLNCGDKMDLLEIGFRNCEWRYTGISIDGEFIDKFGSSGQNTEFSQINKKCQWKWVLIEAKSANLSREKSVQVNFTSA